jgi:hypothetical protein
LSVLLHNYPQIISTVPIDAGLEKDGSTRRLRLRFVDALRRRADHWFFSIRKENGVERLDKMGWVKELPDSERYSLIAQDYVEKIRDARDPERRALIVSPTHAEGYKITTEVRRELKTQGMVGEADRRFECLVPLQWTTAERGDANQYAGDEVLQFHRNSGDYKAGDRAKASEVLASPRQAKPAHFAAFTKSTINLAQGDLIKVTTNGKTLDRKHKLNNGAVYKIQGFTKSGDIALTNGWVVAKNFGQLTHAYVSTAHASQGRTVEFVLVAQSAMSYPASSREGFYVAVSRGKQSATIYTDDKAELKDAVVRSNPRLAATELVKKPKPQLWRRMRQAMARMQLAALVAAKRQMHEIRSEKERELSHGR